jgi:NADH-quinone oxidoreductase subunit L
MKELLWLVVALPFTGALILGVGGRRLSRRIAAVVGVGSVSLAAVVVGMVGMDFLRANPAGTPFRQSLWQWMNVAGLSADMAFRLDTVSLVFLFVITIVGALIHLYSVEFMRKEEGFARFFAFMNLFVGSMLLLVLADNLLALYLGWEGVGACSYLLIGFWYKDPANGYAARKAFIVTRIGDTALLVGFFLLYRAFGTFNIQAILAMAPERWAMGSGVAVATALLLLGGAVGKSAQLPLQTWLPDAMAGPTPVSALIHAATMVTAGVYLMARMHVVFELAPVVMTLVAVIGAVTLLVAGFSALNQHDIKKVLAYSTISQIGYMFLGIGVGAWSAGLFHFFIHAFFKALLFLGAGVVITSMKEEHNIFKMGGLRTRLPLTFWTFLAGAASLSALPLLTAGFYSKDEILWLAYASDKGSIWLWLAGLAGSFLTALYTFRVVFLVFFGRVKTEPVYRPGARVTVPLIVLAIGAIVAGFIQLPGNMGHVTLFSDWIQQTLPAPGIRVSSEGTETLFQVIAALVALSGLGLAYTVYFNKPFPAAEPDRNGLQRFFYQGWDFDLLYDRVIVRPVVFLARIDKDDVIDRFFKGLATAAGWLNRALSATQTGKVRWYAMVIAMGVILTLTIILYL